MSNEAAERSGVVRFDTDDEFWADWWKNWMLYGTVYAINNPEPRIVPADTLTIHEGPCSLAAERRATVERIRAEIGPPPEYEHTSISVNDVLAILDAEAERET